MATESQPEPTREQLQDIAAQLDAGELNPSDEVDITSEATPDQVEEVKPEGSVSPKEAEKEVTPESQDQSPPEAAKEPELDYKAEYEKAQKELTRRDKSWQKLNEEKEKLKSLPKGNETYADGDEYSAEEYERYAEKVIEEGGPDAIKIARQAMTKSKEVRSKSFMDKWNASIQEAMGEEPELADPESELAKTVQETLKNPNWAGFKTAVELAKLKKVAGSIPGFKGEIENYKKEIERLNKAMEVGGKPGLPKKEGSKKFSEMDMKEQSAYLRQKAEEADAYDY